MARWTFKAAVVTVFMLGTLSEVGAQPCNCDAIADPDMRVACIKNQCTPSANLRAVSGPPASGGPPSGAVPAAPESTPIAPSPSVGQAPLRDSVPSFGPR